MISVAASLISIVLPTMASILSLRCRTDGYLSLRLHLSASPSRPEGAEAPSPGQHPGY